MSNPHGIFTLVLAIVRVLVELRLCSSCRCLALTKSTNSSDLHPGGFFPSPALSSVHLGHHFRRSNLEPGLQRKKLLVKCQIKDSEARCERTFAEGISLFFDWKFQTLTEM